MKYFFLLFFLIILSACTAQQTPQVTITPEFSATSTPLLNITPSRTPIPTRTSTATPTPIPNVEIPPRPVTQEDANKVEAFISNDIGNLGSRLLIGELPKDVLTWLDLTLRNIASGVAPDVKIHSIQVGGGGESLGFEPIVFNAETFTKASIEQTGGKLIIISLKDNITFPKNAVSESGYPAPDWEWDFDRIINFFSKHRNKINDNTQFFPLPNGYTHYYKNVSNLVIGLGDNIELQRAFFALVNEITDSDIKYATPRLIFTLDDSNLRILLEDITAVRLIDISGNPNELERDLREAHERVSKANGINWSQFIGGLTIGASVFVDMDQLNIIDAK